MDKLNINGNWEEKKEKLKLEFPALTDKDLDYTNGKEEELIENIKKRLSIPNEIAKKLIRYI